jgi:hypothetical protein
MTGSLCIDLKLLRRPLLILTVALDGHDLYTFQRFFRQIEGDVHPVRKYFNQAASTKRVMAENAGDRPETGITAMMFD